MGKGIKNPGQPVFTQIIKLMDKVKINSIATEMKANRYTKRLDAYTHLVIMLFAVLSHFESLREVVIGFLTSATRLNHFGLDYMVRRSTLADANKRRPSAVFAAVYDALWKRYSGFLSDSRHIKDHGKDLYIMDSTTISLFTDILKCCGRHPKNGKKKGGIKAHTVIKATADVPVMSCLTAAAVHDRKVMSIAERLPTGSYLTADKGYVDYEEWQQLTDKGIFYITRLKKNANFTVIESHDVSAFKEQGIISDEIIEVSYKKDHKRPMTEEELKHRRGRRPKSGIVWMQEWHRGTHRCRRVTKYADNKKNTISFVTNDMESPADVICDLYRRRWQIETLYKRLKGNFPLKYFLGDNVNAIEIQVWVTLIAWLLIEVIHHGTKRKWSFSNMITALRIILDSYIGVYDFLDDPNILWKGIISERLRRKELLQNSLFPEMEGSKMENKRTIACIKGPQGLKS